MFWNHWHVKLLTFFLVGFVCTLCLPLPTPLFPEVLSPLLIDEEHSILDAQVADDEQWRFKNPQELPATLIKATISYEDRFFRIHPGVNPLSLARALGQNLRAKEVVSGGSTLSMQVIRMALGNQPRTISQKIWECLLALKLDLITSKDDILRTYYQHAPFGGNIVGASTASRFYFGRPLDQLSDAELVLISILPNHPGQLYPGKENTLLKQKRDFVIDKMVHQGKLSKERAALAKDEPLPTEKQNIPHLAYHLLENFKKKYGNGLYKSHLNLGLQKQIHKILDHHTNTLKNNLIYNVACVVVDLETNAVKAYIGNTAPSENTRESHVNMVTAKRSPGSLFKPFLYGLALDKKLLLPKEWLPDHPYYQQGFAPQNFNKTFKGAIPADQALASSLNVPFVHLLSEYGYPNFHHALTKGGISLPQPPDHYGMSLILGGFETTALDIISLYTSLIRPYLYAHDRPVGKPFSDQDHQLKMIKEADEPTHYQNEDLISLTALSHMFEAMTQLRRPGEMEHWDQFQSSQRIAWKTGTSYGLRDAWAMGFGDQHGVIVWCGNADNVGRPGLIGAQAAAPIMFDIFDLLPDASFPLLQMGNTVPVCAISGQKPNDLCPSFQDVAVDIAWMDRPSCTYHKEIWTTADGRFRIQPSCYKGLSIRDTVIVLPPKMRKYASSTGSFTPVPDWHPHCKSHIDMGKMEWIYPPQYGQVSIPEEQDGAKGKVILHLVHPDPESKVDWYLNKKYQGSTYKDHRLAILPQESSDTLKIWAADQRGLTTSRKFFIKTEKNSIAY